MQHRNHLSPSIFPYTWASAWGEDSYGLWMTLTYKEVEQTFRWIEPGTFWMGSPQDEEEREGDLADYHQVTLSRGFWIADTTTTQDFWKVIMGKNPSHFVGGNLPVEQVSWNDIQEFIARLNKLHHELVVRLPWEAEWEYACRAGTTTPFSFGTQIDSTQVNFDGNYPYGSSKRSEYRYKTVEVKSLPSNGWGLYEMHGNVWEWCQDGFKDHLGSESVEDARQVPGVYLALRGGSWFDRGGYCRSAIRRRNKCDYRNSNHGFRLVLGD